MVLFLYPLNMFEKLRRKINNSNPALRFIIRLLYPISLYVIFHLLFYNALGLDLRMIQFVFLIIWGGLEWQLFLKRK
jgi:hypothetical protein